MNREMKDSGVEWIGEIPSNINLINTKFLLTYQKGKNPKEINSEGIGLPYIGASDLDNNSENYRYQNYCSEDLPKASKEDVLILWDGARAGLIGTGHAGYMSSTIVKMNSKSDFINQRFWWWYLKGMQPVLYDWVGGTTIPHMNRNFVYDLKFVNLEISKQLKIAMMLDEKVPAIDRIIQRTKSTIEDYKLLKQSIITEAVTKGLDKNVEMKDSGVDWIGEIPKHWQLSKLKYEFRIKKEIAGTEGYDILSVTQKGLKVKDISVNEGQMAADYSKYQFVKVGDYVMNHMDLLTGWVDYSAFNGVTSPDYRVFYMTNPEKNSPEYYKYIFQSCYKNKVFYGLAQGVSNLGRWRLQADKFLNFYIPIPPKEEQDKITDYIVSEQKRYDQIISKKEMLLLELEQYKKSLIYEFVTGKKQVE